MSLIAALLGLPKITEATAPAIVLRHEGQSVQIFAPVIVEKDQFASKATLHFPSSQGFQNRSTVFLSELSLLPIPPKGLLIDRCIKTVDRFNYKKVGKIEEFVRSEGAITFLIENPSKAIEFFKGLDYFKKEFFCAVLWGSQNGGYKTPGTEDDSLTLAITVYDLPYAIPIFNKKKARGMAFSMSLIWPKTSEKIGKLALLNETHFVVNSHYDNVLYVDGVQIRDKAFVGNMVIDQYIGYMETEAERRKKSLKANK